ncbi:transposase [candidate division WOR-3 bacterium]|nr:transposase [candidate division WOR-3 bacterium]
MSKKIISQKHRLEDFDYKGFYAYFLTLCCRKKQKLFKEENRVGIVLDTLRKEAEKFKFKVWAYCFMPDHLHLLVVGNSADSDLKQFVASFKQKSGFLFNKKIRDNLWQKSYYEHILRKNEDV